MLLLSDGASHFKLAVVNESCPPVGITTRRLSKRLEMGDTKGRVVVDVLVVVTTLFCTKQAKQNFCNIQARGDFPCAEVMGEVGSWTGALEVY